MYIKDIQVDILKDMCRKKPKHKVYYDNINENAVALSIDAFMFCILSNNMCFLDVNKMLKMNGIIEKNISDVQNDEETVCFTGDVEIIKEPFKNKSRKVMKLYHSDGKTITYVDRALTKYFDFTHPNVRLSTKRNSTLSIVLVYESGHLVGGVLPIRYV